MARVRSELVTTMRASAILRRRDPVPLAQGFMAWDRLPAERGLVPVADLAVGDTLRDAEGRPVRIAAKVQQSRHGPGHGVRIATAGAAEDVPPEGTIVLEDQRLLLRSPELQCLCGAPAGLARAGDLADAGLAGRFPLADGARYHIVLDRPALLPCGGLELEPFIPTDAALAALDVADRETLFAQAPRLRYPGAAAALRPDRLTLDAREVQIAASGAWTGGSEAGRVARETHPIAKSVPCAPGISGPQPLRPLSGRLRQRPIIF